VEKIKRIWQLTDSPPNSWYEISCYLKAVAGLFLFILGCFLLLSVWLKNQPIILGFAIIFGPLGQAILNWEKDVFGQNFLFLSLFYGILLICLGIWFLGKIKIIRQLFKILKS